MAGKSLLEAVVKWSLHWGWVGAVCWINRRISAWAIAHYAEYLTFVERVSESKFVSATSKIKGHQIVIVISGLWSKVLVHGGVNAPVTLPLIATSTNNPRRTSQHGDLLIILVENLHRSRLIALFIVLSDPATLFLQCPHLEEATRVLSLGYNFGSLCSPFCCGIHIPFFAIEWGRLHRPQREFVVKFCSLPN